MPKGRFLGSVLPLTARISIPEIPYATCYGEGGLVLDLEISIANSIVEVDCTMSHFDEVTFPYAHVKSLDLARAAVDLVAFGTGWGLSVNFHTFIGPDRTRKNLLPSHEGLSQLCTAYKPTFAQPQKDKDFQKMLLLVFEEPPLFLALHDLTQAITESHHAPVNCARAIEGLRTMMGPGEPRAKQWASFRHSLNVQEDYVRLITDQSVAARHGERPFIHGSLVQEVVERSWMLMNRFLEFRKRGNQPLPLAEFPSLANTRS